MKTAPLFLGKMLCGLAVSLLASGTAIAQGVTAFDGTWSVSRTGRGCTPAGTISVQIRSGRISGSYFGGTGRHVVSGTISANGSFRFTGTSSETVRFRGAIRGGAGSGSWSVAGRDCGGTLTMRRG